MPKVFAKVSPLTRTPLVATATVVGVILMLALFFPLTHLAEFTSQVVLTVFMFVNMALVLLKWRGVAAPEGAFMVGLWVPVLGCATCIFVLASSWLVP